MIQNEHSALQLKLDNIKKETAIIESQIALNKETEKH